MELELRHMRAFVALAQRGSFTAASSQLNLTQPALSRTIQQLERVLSVPLVIRSSNRCELTEAGVIFYEKAQRILAEVDGVVNELHSCRRLVIGFSWLLPYPWIHSAVEAYEKEFGVRVELKRRDDLVSSLRRGDIDVAIARRELCGEEISSVCVLSEPRVVAVSRQLELSRRKSVRWDELSNYPIVINTKSGSTCLDQWGEDSRPQVVYTCENYDEWAALVAAGKGIGTLAKSAASMTQYPGVTFLPLEDGPLAHLFLAIRSGEKSGSVSDFIEVTRSKLMSHSGWNG
ncbi:LysR family transcriptional regulator [Arcanobacterium haemolyticum]|nr:LysR family transcriptional regulator [Arcanobacterium haemolyticum]